MRKHQKDTLLHTILPSSTWIVSIKNYFGKNADLYVTSGMHHYMLVVVVSIIFEFQKLSQFIHSFVSFIINVYSFIPSSRSAFCLFTLLNFSLNLLNDKVYICLFHDNLSIFSYYTNFHIFSPTIHNFQ